MTDSLPAGVRIFSTCPQSAEVARPAFLKQVIDVARWSEASGCTGILVYTDNRLVDPWLISQIILQNTERLVPLVAVQPVYMHPYAVAKMVATMGHLFARPLALNMVAGGFKNDLAALADDTPHDSRYEKLVEYTTIVRDLLAATNRGVTLEGSFYAARNLKMVPPLDPELLPEVFVSGSSPAGMAAAQALGATAVKYPGPPSEDPGVLGAAGPPPGIRVGIIARDDGAEAWRLARERFPEDRKGQLTHELAMKVSDSAWHHQLSGLESGDGVDDNPYWLVPFKNYKSFCPYLVGSYARVGEELGKYVGLGYKTFILDIPASPDELEHAMSCFRAAGSRSLP